MFWNSLVFLALATPPPVPPSPPAAGLVLKVPVEVKVAVGRMARVVIDTTGKVVKAVNVYDDEADGFFEGGGTQFVYRFTSGKAGRYKLAFYTADATGPSEPAYCTVIVGDVLPTPVPPTPVPPTPTPPGPTPPGPVAPAKLWVIVIEETAAAAADRGRLFADMPLNAYMTAKGHRWRILDKDVVGPDGQPPKDAKPYLDLSAGKAYPQIFLVTTTGKMVYAGNLPRDPAQILALIKQWGG